MTTTKSPVSTCGVKIVLAFPRNKLAARTATWPSTWSLASITHHLRVTSVALAEKVFIRAEKARKLRDVLRSVKYSREARLTLCPVFCELWLSVLSAAESHAAPKGEGVSAGVVIPEPNIACGRKTPRAIIVALIIDDGRPARTHRKNIFDPSFNYAGAAYGPHALHGSVCTIDFASGYTERPAQALIGRTF